MKIILMCNAGMSTGILQLKLEEEAKKRNIEADVEAIPMGEANENVVDADVILLGPQIRFALEDIKKQFPTRIVLLIDTSDFGMMRADKIFEQVITSLKK